MKVCILSGWSNPGGSTVAHINLTNLFNDNGIDCTFYGPHDWHLDKCKSGKFSSGSELNRLVYSDSRTIKHFLPGSADVLSCHETNLFTVDETLYRNIHYVSKFQKEWHNTDKGVVIPNVISDLEKVSISLHNENVAGIIGSIDRHKQTHKAIEWALSHNRGQIRLFGNVTDPLYYEEHVKKYLDNRRVVHFGHVDDKQQIYNSISCVYHCSKRETFNFIKAECEIVGLPYYGEDSADPNAEYWPKYKILKSWLELLGL